MKQLKIGLVLDDTLDSTDGVQQYVLVVGAWLTAQGHEVHYLVGQTTRTDIPHVHSLSRNFRVRFNGNRLSIPWPTSRRKLRRLLIAERFDVLHVQMPYSPWLGQRIIQAAPAGTVIVGAFHILPYSWLATMGSRLLAWWLRPSLRRFDRIFANTVATQHFVRQIYRQESTVLPLPVTVDRFAAAKPFAQYADATRTLLFLGRLVPRKGARTLLEAAKILRGCADVPPFRVLICGKGPLDVELQRYAADHGMSDAVIFTGFVPEADKPRYLASADVVVYPSSGGESFGVVLLEAMAAGALVLAGDNPGYRSVLAARPELLFTPKDAAGLADKIATYLRTASAREAAIAWEKTYVRQFDIDAIGPKLLATYIELLHCPRP